MITQIKKWFTKEEPEETIEVDFIDLGEQIKGMCVPLESYVAHARINQIDGRTLLYSMPNQFNCNRVRIPLLKIILDDYANGNRNFVDGGVEVFISRWHTFAHWTEESI